MHQKHLYYGKREFIISSESEPLSFSFHQLSAENEGTLTEYELSVEMGSRKAAPLSIKWTSHMTGLLSFWSPTVKRDRGVMQWYNANTNISNMYYGAPVISVIQQGDENFSTVAVSDAVHPIRMTFSVNDFEEKELLRMPTREDCDFYFDKYVKKYTEKKVPKEETPIPKRYLKFAKDYKAVYDSCKEVFSQSVVDDGGASNFDACTVFIGKRLKKGFLNAALKPYGLKAHIEGDLIFLVVPFTQYQGFGNTAQAEYMCKMFNNMGYESAVFYRID